MRLPWHNFFFFFAVIHAQFSCTFNDTASGTYYNLNGLTMNAATGDYYGSDDKYNFVMNVCAVCNTGGSCSASNATICQYENGLYESTIATTNQPDPVWSLIDSSAPTKGVQLQYNNGDVCFTTGQPRVVTVMFFCNPAAAIKEAFSVVENNCSYNISLTTPNACPISGDIPELRAGYNTTTSINANSFTLWQIPVMNTSAELRITVNQTNPTNMGNVYLYARYGAPPTSTSYDRIDASYSLSHEIVIRTTDTQAALKAGTYYIGIQSFGYTINYVLRADTFLCPGACSGHGLCVNQKCSCDAGYTMIDCSATVMDINLDQIYTGTLWNTQTAFYRLSITDYNEFQLVCETNRTGGYAVASLAIGAGYYPTTTKNDGLVRDPLAPGPSLVLTVYPPVLDTGIWLIAVIGQDDEYYSYNFSAHLYDCPNNCSNNGVCNSEIHVCTCQPDWAGTNDCSRYQYPLNVSQPLTFYLPGFETFDFKINVNNDDVAKNLDLVINIQSAPGSGGYPMSYVQYRSFPTATSYYTGSASPVKSAQVLRIAAKDLQTGSWYVSIISETPSGHPATISYNFEGDCTFCVHGGCNASTLACACDDGYQGVGCDVATPSSSSGTSVGVTVALVFVFLFLGLAIGVLLKRQFPSLCGESPNVASIQSRELIPKYSAM